MWFKVKTEQKLKGVYIIHPFKNISLYGRVLIFERDQWKGVKITTTCT